ncbi:hypothetical protein GZ77_11100 [Endozoicomonas montiporae]|uniref:AMMECR1 domain-containing protein n=2 Tax=Endozoicomonas montiporae TaxID=1027273 RepID=A0A081N8P3_9GAMM|nr:AmmeMemoRadiSam system protein A [Endozoicomonas montiporae]AMO55280.1 AMMECR1 domain-containing protein [Endozoicomonas montiporae CL-33]KEQ14816.1 hypothetical protein GZ77_11100 [Endozoicomonas montiporae]
MELSLPQQKELLRFARKAIADSCRQGLPPEAPADDLPALFYEPRATFVTLQKQGNLRGCIGSLQVRRPLIEDIIHNAFAAAFRDPRFHPVAEAELNEIDIEISILSPLSGMNISSEDDLLQQLIPGQDGLVIENAHYSATFLPQVWEQLPQPKQFLQHLKQKAGMPVNEWPDDMKCFRYSCFKFKEK